MCWSENDGFSLTRLQNQMGNGHETRDASSAAPVLSGTFALAQTDGLAAGGSSGGTLAVGMSGCQQSRTAT
jgi:hypothetical protein